MTEMALGTMFPFIDYETNEHNVNQLSETLS